MPLTRNQLALGGLLVAITVGAAVFAIGGRYGQIQPGDSVVPPPLSDPDVDRNGAVLSYWAKTSDFDTAPADATRDSEAPPFVPPVIYPAGGSDKSQ